MGFFFDEREQAKPEKRSAATTRKIQADPSARGCDVCTLRETWPRLTTPQMRMDGQAGADVLVLGEAPGEHEDKQGRQFVGESGQLLRRTIPGREHDRLAWQNAVRCRPNENRTPTVKETWACSLHLDADLAKVKPKAIIGVGATPLHHFWPGAAIHRVHGVRFPIRVADRVIWYYPIHHPAFVLRTAGDRRNVQDGSLWPVFNADIKRFFETVDRWPAAKIADLDPAKVIVPKTEADARGLLARMSGPLGIDFEAWAPEHVQGDGPDGLKPMSEGWRCLTCAFSDGSTTIAFAVDHPEQVNAWAVPLILETIAARPWVEHSALELKVLLWLARANAQAEYEPASFDDTQALARLFYHRNTLAKLGELSRAVLGVDIKAISSINTRRILEYPLAEILPYNGLDAQATALIRGKLRKGVHEANYQSLIAAARTVTEMELAGLPVDIKAAQDLSADWRARAQEATEAAARCYEVKTFERERGRKFNIAAPEDVGHALVEYGKVKLPKTKSEKTWSTDEADLQAAVEQGNPLAKATLAYRGAAKMDSTYLQSVLAVPKRYPSGLIHPGYTTTHVITLRLSAEDPNIQNWPKRNAEERSIRRCIVAPPGMMMYAFDFGQLEARILAMAAKDRAFCAALIDDFDVHSHWRDYVLDIYPEYYDHLAAKTKETDRKKVLKAGRDTIKTDFVFASFYGSAASSVAARTGMPLDVATSALSVFWQEYKTIRDWIKARHREYRDTGSISNLMGVERHTELPGNEPINTPIQSSAARVVSDAMNEMSALSRELKEPLLHPRINIHDDLTFFFPEDEDAAIPYIEIVEKTLTKIRYDFQIVPLTIEAKLGRSWFDLEEFAVMKGDYIR